MATASGVFEAFEQRYGIHPRQIVRAPGRVNLIGEHTDYNDGFVLPVAIDRATYIAARAREDDSVHVYAQQPMKEDTFTLSAITHNEKQNWSNYVRGVVKALLARIPAMAGANLLIDGDVPMGSGLSSSASLEVATGYAFQLLNDIDLLGEELALLCQGAENSFVGVRCGIMDQFISALGQADHALMLDCRDLSYLPVPIPADVRIVVSNSNVKHAHGDSGYNQRRTECEEAVQALKKYKPKITALRDVTVADLERAKGDMSEVVFRRARHVVTENDRVQEAGAALEAGDVERFGQLMYASHDSMRDDYEISVPEINTLVEIAHDIPGCYGSRLTGGGFGGCTVSIVAADAVERFEHDIVAGYKKATNITPPIYVCRASDGVGRAR